MALKNKSIKLFLRLPIDDLLLNHEEKEIKKDEYHLYIKCNLMSSVCFFLSPCPLFIDRKYPSKIIYIFVTCLVILHNLVHV